MSHFFDEFPVARSARIGYDHAVEGQVPATPSLEAYLHWHFTRYDCNSWLSSEWKPAWLDGPGGTGTSSVIFRNMFVIAKWYLQKPSSHKFLLLLLWSSSSRTQGIERKTRKIRRNKTSVVKRNLHHRFYMLLDYSHLNTSVVFISYISYKILVPV